MAPVTPASERPRLREAIIEHLRQEGSDSISGIARHLSGVAGSPVHRLSIAGYLMAMADEGTLREVDRPPSKHYQLADPDAHKTLHQRLGEVVATMELPAPERSTLVVAALQHLLGRPIFQEELHHAGFPRAGPGIETIEASEEERREYRALFSRRHATDLEIPRADPLLSVRQGALRSGALQEAVRRLVLAGLPGVEPFIADRPDEFARGVQTHLRLEAPE